MKKEINPQREDGHVDVANELVEALAKTQLSGYESRVLWALFRETWGHVLRDKHGKFIKDEKTGWLLKRKTAVITSRRWCKLTNLTKSHVSDTLRRLRLRRIVSEIGNRNEWGFQKLYNQWLPPIRIVVTENGNTYFVTKNGNTFAEIGNTFAEIGNKNLPKSLSDKLLPYTKKVLKESIKESIKDNVQKKVNKVHFDYDKGKFIGITEKYKSELKERYPNCNIDKQFKRMADWLLDNPNKKRQGKRTFINSWLEKANSNYKKGDRCGKNQKYNTKRDGKDGRTGEDKYKHLEEIY